MAASYPCTFLGLKVFQVSRGCLGICSKTWLSSLTCGPVPDCCGRCWAQGCVWEPVSALSRAPSCVQPQDLFCTCTLRSLANSGAGGTDSLMSTALWGRGSRFLKRFRLLKRLHFQPKNSSWIIKKVCVLLHIVTVLKLEAIVSGHAFDANFNIWETRYKVSYPWNKGEKEILMEKPVDHNALIRWDQRSILSLLIW